MTLFFEFLGFVRPTCYTGDSRFFISVHSDILALSVAVMGRNFEIIYGCAPYNGLTRREAGSVLHALKKSNSDCPPTKRYPTIRSEEKQNRFLI